MASQPQTPPLPVPTAPKTPPKAAAVVAPTETCLYKMCFLNLESLIATVHVIFSQEPKMTSGAPSASDPVQSLKDALVTWIYLHRM